MSYCRHNGMDSDVYFFDHVTYGRLCMGCLLLGDGGFDVLCYSAKKSIEHLKMHKELGHKVPATAFTRLRKEMKVEQLEEKKWQKKLKVSMKNNQKKHKARMKKGKPFWDKLMKKIENSPTNKKENK